MHVPRYRRNYLAGVSANLETVSRHLPPDFRVRLYYQVPPGSPTLGKLCDLACRHSKLDLCDVERNPKYHNASILYPLVWRFLPLVDPQVSLLLSRDLDSEITAREAAALREFLDHPEAKVHVMRDNQGHDIGMLGEQSNTVNFDLIKIFFLWTFNR